MTVLSPMGWGKLAFVLVPGGDAGRILAELPLPDPSPTGWDLKALKTGGEMLCPLPGQLPQEGVPPHPGRGSRLGSGQNKGGVSRMGISEGPRSRFLLCKGDHSPSLGHSGRVRPDGK